MQHGVAADASDDPTRPLTPTGRAEVVMSDRELPAWGSVSAMVPCHLPSSIWGT